MTKASKQIQKLLTKSIIDYVEANRLGENYNLSKNFERKTYVIEPNTERKVSYKNRSTLIQNRSQIVMMTVSKFNNENTLISQNILN